MPGDSGATETLVALLVDSLALWRVSGQVAATVHGVLITAENGIRVTVRRLDDPALPLRWQVETQRPGDGEPRPAKSYAALPGMLRAVRAALDPDAPAARLTFGLGAGLS